MKKVVVVGTVGIPACYGGFESLVENLTKLSPENVSYQVFCSEKSYSDKKIEHNNAKLIYLPLSANGVQSVPYDILSLVKSLFIKPDVTLILGVSGCVFLPIYRFFSNSRIITNIDGLEWKRDKWGKLAKKFLKFSEKIAVRYSDIVIADNQVIADYVRTEYGVNTMVIAYGGDHVIPLSAPNIEVGDYFFTVCRIEPENNVEMILEAFSKTSCKLKFVGNWNKSEYGKKLKNTYSVYNNIEIIEPVYDMDELYKLRAGCIGYIHGHSAGGTNPSLVEAMHFGKTIFCYDCDFNRHSTDNKAIFFANSDDLKTCIDDFMLKDITKYTNNEMLDIAKEKYTWDIISKLYQGLY
ncbi:TPA: DUF1972 domain-containing protein [Vibrio campbellii]|uniref:DUF1972 domain-containing protein n=1 Tax=Vibrio campbellii TaxID=680 RepID=UPI00390B4467